MTIIRDYEIKCEICGETSTQPVLVSTNTWGYPDLDLRPAEMQRSTMNTWVHECPCCGYVSSHLKNEDGIGKEFLESKEYQSCGGLDFISDLSKRFYKRYLIAKKTGNLQTAFYSILNCMWKCDDEDDPLASDMRRMLVRMTDELIESSAEDKDNLIIMKADYLRRSGQFDELIKQYENLKTGKDNHDRIISFQIKKARERDDSCYTTEVIFEK